MAAWMPGCLDASPSGGACLPSLAPNPQILLGSTSYTKGGCLRRTRAGRVEGLQERLRLILPRVCDARQSLRFPRLRTLVPSDELLSGAGADDYELHRVP